MAGANVLRRSRLFRSRTLGGSAFCSRVQDLHRALEQVFKITLFDSWNQMSEIRALRDHDGSLFGCLEIGLNLIHRDTSCKRIAGLRVVNGRVDSFRVARGPGIKAT